MRRRRRRRHKGIFSRRARLILPYGAAPVLYIPLTKGSQSLARRELSWYSTPHKDPCFFPHRQECPAARLLLFVRYRGDTSWTDPLLMTRAQHFVIVSEWNNPGTLYPIIQKSFPLPSGNEMMCASIWYRDRKSSERKSNGVNMERDAAHAKFIS